LAVKVDSCPTTAMTLHTLLRLGRIPFSTSAPRMSVAQPTASLPGGTT
jgi:hypothetical protein